MDLTTLADDIAVMEAGEVVSQGPAERMLSRPTSRFVAQLAGMNLLRGHLRGGGFSPDRNGEHWAAFPHSALSCSPQGELTATVLADLGAETLLEIDGQRVTAGQPASGKAPGERVAVALDKAALSVYPRT